MKKRIPPHILADENFNPPAVEQHSYSAGGAPDGVLQGLLCKNRRPPIKPGLRFFQLGSQPQQGGFIPIAAHKVHPAG